MANNPWWNGKLSYVRSKDHYVGRISAKKHKVRQAVTCLWALYGIPNLYVRSKDCPMSDLKITLQVVKQTRNKKLDKLCYAVGPRFLMVSP